MGNKYNIDLWYYSVLKFTERAEDYRVTFEVADSFCISIWP